MEKNGLLLSQQKNVSPHPRTLDLSDSSKCSITLDDELASYYNRVQNYFPIRAGSYGAQVCAYSLPILAVRNEDILQRAKRVPYQDFLEGGLFGCVHVTGKI